MTRALLWEEYRAACPGGFGYTWFCTHYDAWKGRVRPASHQSCAFSATRQTHVGGEKVFVDFAGDTVDVIDPDTGEVRSVKLFVAASRRRRASGTTGASNYTYAEAVASEGLEDWIGAHVRMFAFLGGVPKVVVPDNLKSAVFKADRFDPGLNRTYAEMAGYYGTAVLPARPYKPRDKAKVEVAVQVAQHWSLARLRNLLYGPDGAAFSPTHTRKGGRLYRYYVSQTVLKHGAGSCPVGRVPAREIETAVIDQLRAVLRQPEIVAGTWKAARAQDGDIIEADARDALTRLDPLWDELFPADQARIAALLVERVGIGTDGLNVRLRMDGLTRLAREMMADLEAAA